MIPLNIVILPALSATPAPDPLFHFAGGPGEAATEQAAGNAQRFASIRKERDIVMVDQRGTGGSNELTCVFEGSRERATLLFGGIFPDNEIAKCRSELEKRADLRLYHTDIAVQDADEVRAWLGYEKINIYGGSYGTKAALFYMRRFSDRVRTSTLRAVQSVESSMLENARDAQDALDRAITACASEAPCAAAYPNLRAELASALSTADTRPASLRVFDGIRKDTVEIAVTRGVFAGALRRLLMDATTARSVPLAIHQAATGDWTIMRVGLTRTLAISADIAWGMMVSIICTEEPPKIVRGDIARAAAGTFYGDAQIKTIVPSCAKWSSGTPPRDYDQPVKSTVPTLLLSGEIDPTTPPRMSEMTARALPNSLRVVMPGVSHGPFPQCAVDVMTGLVVSGTVKGIDTSCVQSMRREPFVVP
jgi:pimeloyl-ACP methyl ester carboxylesterase